MMKKTDYTLQDIRLLRLRKQREVDAKAAEIAAKVHSITSPQVKTSPLSSVLSIMTNGAALVDGFLIGRRVIRIIRHFIK